MNEKILEVLDLKVYFKINRGLFSSKESTIKAVDGVSFTLREKEILGIAGESGSGKSTIAKCIAGLIKPTSGRILFEGEDIFNFKGKKFKHYRMNVQMVFQNPFTSLNPLLKIRDTLSDVLKAAGKRADEKILHSLMDSVNLEHEILDKYPSELSGGQAQRVAIARALATEPKLLILDEPTSALDVSIQAQILKLLKNIHKERGVSYILISHDISVIRYLCERVIIMRRGKIVEDGKTDEIIRNPKEEYTKQLVKSLMELYGYLEN